MVLLHLFFCQQWWPPTPAHLQQWWLPIVNGWCRPFAAHAMATNPTEEEHEKRGGGIPLFAFCCHPPSTSKSHHIGFRPVLQESPSSPLSP